MGDSALLQDEQKHNKLKLDPNQSRYYFSNHELKKRLVRDNLLCSRTKASNVHKLLL